MLYGFTGTLQTDGYEGYNAVVAAGRPTYIGCFAHTRRRFDEAVKVQGKHTRRSLANRGLALIRKRYAAAQNR